MSAFKTGRKREYRSATNKWKALVEENLIGESSVGRNRIFASSAGLCKRQTAGLFMFPKGAKEIQAAPSQFYFKIGSAIEKVMDMAFTQAGVFVDAETRVEIPVGDTTLSGRIDFVIRDPDDGELVLVELKSCGRLPTKPKDYQLAQLKTYMVITGMERGLLWYVSRNVAGYDREILQTVFEIKLNDRERAQVAYNISIGAVFGLAGVLPHKPDEMKRYKCGFCPLVPMCWEDEDLGLKTKKASAAERRELLKQAGEIVDEILEGQAARSAEFKALFK